MPLEESGSPYLVSPGRVTKDDGTPYKVFTPFYAAWREHGWRAPAESGPKSAQLDRPGGRSPAASTFPTPESNSSIARRRDGGAGAWKHVRRTNGLDDYAEDRNRPDVDGTSRMSAHLKFGTIHPRTMAADLDKRQWRPGLPARVGLPRLLRRRAARLAGQRVVELEHALRRASRSTRMPMRRSGSRRGRPAARAFRSSTPACGSSPRPASCTTGFG